MCIRKIKTPIGSWNNLKSDSSFTIVAKLFLPCKNKDVNLIGKYSRFGHSCPKLEHTTQLITVHGYTFKIDKKLVKNIKDTCI